MTHIFVTSKQFKILLENGKIDLSTHDIIYLPRTDNENEDDEMEYLRERILEKHPYKIWFQESTGFWCTYLKVDGKKKQKRKKSLVKLQDAIVDHARHDDRRVFVVPKIATTETVEWLFDKWVNMKKDRGDIKVSTFSRYQSDFNFISKINDFCKMPLCEVGDKEIEDFLLTAVVELKLTQQRFTNIKGIVRAMFKYAKKQGYTDISISQILDDMEYSQKMFRKVRHEDDELVFMEDEMVKVYDYFDNKELDLLDCGILLAFITGLRPGELASLKWQDLDKNILHIRRCEIKYREAGMQFVEVQEDTKTDAGWRDVIVPDKGMYLFDRLTQISEGVGHKDNFIFYEKHRRKTVDAFDDRLARICDWIGITRKSMNKIRKTYCTMLVDAGLDKNIIMAQVGHTDISTTMRFYYKNRKSYHRKNEAINNVFANGFIM